MAVELDEVARHVLEERYLLQDDQGRVVETPDEMFQRVAANLAEADARLGGDRDAAQGRFYEAMRELRFLPNSPTLMNAGTELQQLAACFVLPVEDSLDAIFDAVKHTALIHQSGGGTGFSFSKLRPQGAPVRSTGGVASGPISFMKVFDAATEQIKQGGRRRGANMGVLAADHPDVEDFVTAKREEGALRNFNTSLATDEAFWRAIENGDDYPLVDPHTGETVDGVDPRRLLSLAAEAAWETGDPGLLFVDRINEDNPTPQLGDIEATNPCGEQPLLPYEACVLGSVNLSRFSREDEIDWSGLEATVRTGVRMLDAAVGASRFPLQKIEQAVARTRKIGLGMMGLADLLVDLGIPYDSSEGIDKAGKIAQRIDQVARQASQDLARERGAFPAFEESALERPRRNATVTTVAPTGTISLIAGCSAGIEPIYNVAYTKHVLGGLEIVNDRFESIARERGFYSERLVEDLEDETSIQGDPRIPEDVQSLFKTAHDVEPEHHLRMQAAIQDHVDNAVSKTVNLPPDATVDDVQAIFERARELGVKGITVFRSGSKPEQVLGEDPLKEECVTECDYVGPGRREAGEAEGLNPSR